MKLKRFLALVLTIIMTASMMPMEALAAPSTEKVVSIQ